MKLYRTASGYVLEQDGSLRSSRDFDLDVLFTGWAKPDWTDDFDQPVGALEDVEPLAPIDRQEVWAAGVTYYRSREARMEESEREADVYDRVYDAERPELFFKATPHRVADPGCGCGDPGGFGLERARGRARARGRLAGTNLWLHRRQRHELPLDRGGEPAISAPGEDL